MSRKSKADLAVVPLAGGGRPPPPDELDELEQAIWKAVCDASPAHAIDPAVQLMLRRLAAQAAICTCLESRLRALRAEDQDLSEDAQRLAAAHGVAAKAVTALLASLRLTPQARVRLRAASAEKVPIARPWERELA